MFGKPDYGIPVFFCVLCVFCVFVCFCKKSKLKKEIADDKKAGKTFSMQRVN